MSRTITLFSTRGGRKRITTNAATWGEIKAEVEGDYDLSNLQATENKTMTTLTHPEAMLPEGDFTIFLRPVKTKSGLDVEGLGFRELRALVSDDAVKNYLNNYSNKNWTQLSTTELKEALASYTYPGTASTLTASDPMGTMQSVVDTLSELVDQFSAEAESTVVAMVNLGNQVLTGEYEVSEKELESQYEAFVESFD